MTRNTARNLLRASVCFPALLLLALAVTAHSASAAQSPAPAAANNIEGTWQGTLHAQRDLRTVVKVSKAPNGALDVTLYSIDQGGQPIRATSASFQDGVFNYAILFIDGSFEGRMSADGKSITGTWTQGGGKIPIVLERATPETAWAIPEAPKPMPMMAASADPNFEVATIKPSQPGAKGQGFIVRGRQFRTMNTSLSAMIGFAYDVQEKQVIGLPDWAATEKFDIDAQPDLPGIPDSQQLKNMLRKLLAERFQLKFHPDKTEMSAYVLTVAKDGPKMTKDTGDPNGLPALFFRQLGVLTVHNATMNDFSQLLQSAVLDRPVVNHTGLDGRWDFLLKWTPDESQFSGMGIHVTPPTDTADAPPPLFTALPEQLGLRMEAEKTPVSVMVIDHVDHPSPN